MLHPLWAASPAVAGAALVPNILQYGFSLYHLRWLQAVLEVYSSDEILLLLGDMGSLDLGTQGDDGNIVDDNVDDW